MVKTTGFHRDKISMKFKIYDQVVVKSNAGFWKNEPGIIPQIPMQDIYYVYLYRWNKDPYFRENELRFATEKEQLSENGWKLLQKQIKDCKIRIEGESNNGKRTNR